MKRRSFLRGLAGAAAAGPSAAQQTMASLQVPIPRPGNDACAEVAVGSIGPRSRTQYAHDRLNALTKINKRDFDRQLRNYHIRALEPDHANLRSVNLQTKIRMSRAQAFRRELREDKGYFRGIIDGLWD